MKKIAALVTTFVLGISGAAMAAPANHFPAPRPVAAAPFRPVAKSWVTLSSGSLTRGKDQLAIGSRARYTTLKLEATRGSMYINDVVITFANGAKQVVSLDKTIAGRSAATIDLKGNTRAISKIVVTGKGGFRSSYSLLAV